MNINYNGFYLKNSLVNMDVEKVLLKLSEKGITYPISIFDNTNIYIGGKISDEGINYIKSFNLEEDSIFLRNNDFYYFGMGQSIWGFDYINFDIFYLNQIPFDEVINKRIKVSFLINNQYNFIQSTDNPQTYESHKIKYDKSKLYFNENIQMELLDISENVGRERKLEGFKFYPAYKIWFGEEAQELFGKEKILQFKKAIYIKELPCGVIEMQLMDDINKCHLPYNQEKQKAIVEYLEIDKLEIPKYE